MRCNYQSIMNCTTRYLYLFDDIDEMFLMLFILLLLLLTLLFIITYEFMLLLLYNN